MPCIMQIDPLALRPGRDICKLGEPFCRGRAILEYKYQSYRLQRLLASLSKYFVSDSLYRIGTTDF